MTSSQRARFFGEWWPDACASQGWNPEDREKRLDFFEDVLGVRKSFTLFTERDLDLVKARCLLLADNLKGAMEDGKPEIGERRRLVHVIETFPAPYWRKIARSRFGSDDLDALDVSQLTQLRNTLNARKNSLRRQSKQPKRPEPGAVAEENIPAENIPF